MKALFSVVIPVFNEEASLDELVDRCVATCDALDRPYEILLIDDGSSDGSRDRIAAKAAQYVGRVRGTFLNHNYGQHNAVICGFAGALGETVITLDADLQNPPEEIPRLLEKADEGFDVVATVRINRRDSLFRRLASHAINWMVERTTGVKMHDYGCMLRAYSRKVVQAILECPERSTFVPILANSFATTTTEIDVSHYERKAGKSKYGPMRLVHLMFDLMTTMTTAPLRLLTIGGGFWALFGGFLGVALLLLRLVFGSQWAVEGVFTLFALVFFFVGAQFMALGLLGEYIGRIQIDVRARPRYFVDREVGESWAGRARPKQAASRREPKVRSS